MKKQLVTLLLIFFATTSIVAQYDKITINNIEISNLSIDQDIFIDQDFKPNFHIKNVGMENTMCLIEKHKILEYTSRRLRVKNIVNFLNNSENRNINLTVLC